MIRCHLCEEDNGSIQDECNEERKKLSLRPGGDERLDKRAAEWGDRILRLQLEAKTKVESLNGAEIP